MEIKLKNKTVLIDDEDFEIANRSPSWFVMKNSVGQIYFSNSKREMLHRLIVNCPKGKVVDHINGNTLDNRKENLRICSKLENQYNQKKHKGKKQERENGEIVQF